MNIQDNLELLNHQLHVSNNKLLLQVEVQLHNVEFTILSQQNNLLNKKLEEQYYITNQIQYLQNENNQLKKDILILQESLFNLKNEKNNDIEQSYSSMLLVLSKENEKELTYLKKEYKDHIFRLQQEKNQFFEQAVSIGIQNQTAKNLELQTTKIIQIAQKLEKIICESQQNQENKIEKAKTAREIYDNLINQLNTDLNKNQREYEKSDKLNHTQTTTKNFNSVKQNDKPNNLTKLLSLTKTNETPRNRAYLNGLSLQTVNKNN